MVAMSPEFSTAIGLKGDAVTAAMPTDPNPAVAISPEFCTEIGANGATVDVAIPTPPERKLPKLVKLMNAPGVIVLMNAQGKGKMQLAVLVSRTGNGEAGMKTACCADAELGAANNKVEASALPSSSALRSTLTAGSITSRRLRPRRRDRAAKIGGAATNARAKLPSPHPPAPRLKSPIPPRKFPRGEKLV